MHSKHFRFARSRINRKCNAHIIYPPSELAREIFIRNYNEQKRTKYLFEYIRSMLFADNVSIVQNMYVHVAVNNSMPSNFFC